MRAGHVLSQAGVIVLAYFLLVAYLVTLLRGHRRLVAIIGAIAGLVGVLPAILYALGAMPPPF
jgi:hypothetical protein